ncbi:MAG: glutamate--tRNA ligase [Clostridia bacterium]|nr:glutamate--tRNA ligase [Clostridia bacterium]
MDNNKLAELLFPEIDKLPSFWEQKYQKRNLSQGEEVTRYAPSPTGFVHFGALFASLADFLVAKKSKGVVFLRIEDTDKKREVLGGVQEIVNTLKSFNINFDEGESFGGEYGPYIQSEREEIYKTYAKELVKKGKAYPCFCSESDLEHMREKQEKNKENIGYHGEYAVCRNLSYEQIEQKIKNGEKFVLRFKCPYNENDKVEINDIIRGKRVVPQNINDVVIIKSNGLPPYNLAHAVDDHLMQTTLVIRGDEWFSSLSEHLQLFEALGFTPPKYAHISPIQKVDENGNRRKLSKRKDPEADMNFFAENGYPVGAVKDYILTLLNSDFEQWRAQNPKEDILNFDFSLKKMSASGSLFDIKKLTDISKNYISGLTNIEVYDLAKSWAEKYDKQLYKNFVDNKNYWLDILNIDRNIPKPRKDLSHFKEIFETYNYMFDEEFIGKNILKENNIFELLSAYDKEAVLKVLQEYPKFYDECDEQSVWFDKIKDLSEKIGFAREVKEFKQNPEKFKGHCGDVSTIIRVAITGRTQTPNLYEILKLLGKDSISKRLKLALEVLNSK